MSDLKDELEQERKSKEWAETWKPSGPGDALIGTLEGYDEATTDFGTYTVAHVRNEDGVLKGLWMMHSVLRDEWKEAAPEVGERVGAMYHGKRSGSDFDYHMWSVRVDRSEETTESSTRTGAAAKRDPQEPKSEAGGNPAPQEPSAPDGRKQPEKLYGGGEETKGSGPSLDDPNSGLLF